MNSLLKSRLFQAKTELGKRNIIHERRFCIYFPCLSVQGEGGFPRPIWPTNKAESKESTNSVLCFIYRIKGIGVPGCLPKEGNRPFPRLWNWESGSFSRATGQVLRFKHIRIRTERSRRRNSASSSYFLLTCFFFQKLSQALIPQPLSETPKLTIQKHLHPFFQD